MASKHSHVDNMVNERRLRPIYDRLDNGNNKKAIQEADRVLKKHPNNQCARVLKALALLRLGKEDECQMIIDKVRDEVPCEDNTLQAMTICYRESHQPDKISEVYEAAAKADPKNEDILTHLFMAYVRQGDFKKQQHTALALYKIVPNNPYYFWAVMSLVMQAHQTKDNQAKNLSLSLAERMVLKMVKEDKMDAEQEIQLYLLILELQDKKEEMYNVLNGPLGCKLSLVPQKKAKLLLDMKRYEEAKLLYEDLIKNDRDNWSFYKNYLDAALQCQKASECFKFLKEIVETMSSCKIRAPYLAQLEFVKRLLDQDKESLENGEFDTIPNLLYLYFQRFGTKDCVIADIKIYLPLLKDDEKQHLILKLQDFVGLEEGLPNDMNQMQRHIHLEQFKRMCGIHHSPKANIEERKRLFKRYCDLYEKGNSFYPAETRLRSEYYSSDWHLLLACHILLQLWFETSNAEWLYKALPLLEKGLILSPANFQIKMLLIRIYLEAGLTVGADYAYSLLECKHIQLDSLGYLLTTLLAPLGNLSQASNALDQTSKFFVSNYKDSSEHLTYAYKYGSFVKIQEFVELRERLENSIHFATTTVDKMLLELSWSSSYEALNNSLNSMQITPGKDTINWELLQDNRDVEVIAGWEPLSSIPGNPRMKAETRECMIQLLGARSLILRILAATNESESLETLKDLANKLKKLTEVHIPVLLDKFEVNGKSKTDSVIVPTDAVERLREAYQSEQLSLIAEFTLLLSESKYPNDECIKLLRKSTCIQIPTLPDSTVPVSFKKFFFRANTCGETLAYLSAISIAFAQQSKPNISKKKIKKKIIKDPVCNSNCNENQNWHEIAHVFQGKIQSLDSLLSSELDKSNITMGLDTEEEEEMIVLNRLLSSLTVTSSLLVERLNNTLKLIRDLKS